MAVKLSRAALKGLHRMPKKQARRMVGTLKGLKPGALHPDVKRLRGSSGVFRLREGDWRALFTWDGGDLLVSRIAHRKEVYR